MRFNLASRPTPQQPPPPHPPQPQSHFSLTSQLPPPLPPSARQPVGPLHTPQAHSHAQSSSSYVPLSTRAPPAFLPSNATYGDDAIAMGLYYSTTAPDSALGQAASHQSTPLPRQYHHSRLTQYDSTTQPHHHQHALPSPLSSPSPPPPPPPSMPTQPTLPFPHAAGLQQHPPTSDETENDMRRTVLQEPFNLFLPAGLATLPNPLEGGAFLPLRFVATARTRTEELHSGPWWSLYLYGPLSRVVAFCLHPDCVRTRQEENPLRGFMCPPNKMSMNRHFRKQHKMYDPRLEKSDAAAHKAKKEAKERQQKADGDDDNDDEQAEEGAEDEDGTSQPKKRKKGKAGSTAQRRPSKATRIKTEDGKAESGASQAASSSGAAPPPTPRKRQKMNDHSTSKTWQDDADLQRNAPTTPVWQQQLPSSGSSAYSSSSSSSTSPTTTSLSSSSSSSSSTSSSSPPATSLEALTFSSSPSSSSSLTTRNRLSSVVYPYNLMAAMREFGGFLAHFVRLNWNLLAGQVRRLSQTNDLGRLVAQLHILNDHGHTVRFHTAAGLISDNDGVCTTRAGSTETATRIRGAQYEVAVECRECQRRVMEVLVVGRHYVLMADLGVREMTVEEYAGNQQRTGYRLPPHPTEPGVMRLDGDVFDAPRRDMEARYAQWYAAYGVQQPPRPRM